MTVVGVDDMRSLALVQGSGAHILWKSMRINVYECMFSSPMCFLPFEQYPRSTGGWIRDGRLAGQVLGFMWFVITRSRMTIMGRRGEL